MSSMDLNSNRRVLRTSTMEQRKQRDEMKVPGDLCGRSWQKNPPLAVAEKWHICKSHPNGLLPGCVFQQWQWGFHSRAWIFHLGPTRGYWFFTFVLGPNISGKIGALGSVCFVKWSTVNSRQDQMIRVTFIGNMLAAWSCWNDEVTPPEQNIWRAGVNRKNGTWNRDTEVLKWFEGFFGLTLFYQVPRGKLHFLLLHTRKTIFTPQILAHHEDSQTSAKRNNYYSEANFRVRIPFI